MSLRALSPQLITTLSYLSRSVNLQASGTTFSLTIVSTS